MAGQGVAPDHFLGHRDQPGRFQIAQGLQARARFSINPADPGRAVVLLQRLEHSTLLLGPPQGDQGVRHVGWGQGQADAGRFLGRAPGRDVHPAAFFQRLHWPPTTAHRLTQIA